MSRWLLDFAADPERGADASAIAGFVRLELRPREQIAWYWTYLVGVPDVDGVVVVRDHEVLPPRQALEIRADGLWAELWCEHALEHWTFGLEAFGVRIDAPDDALRAGDEIGERIAVGLDIEWEVGENGPPAGSVHGDVLVGRARHTIDGPGLFYDDGTADPGAIAGDAVATVKIPLDSGAGRYVERRLVRTEAGLRWSFEEHAPDR